MSVSGDESDESNCNVVNDEIDEEIDEQQSDLLRYHERKWKLMLTKTKLCDSPNNIPNQCRIWTAGKTTNGYGAVTYRGKKRRRRAHRVSWMIANKVDDVPTKNDKGEKLEIRHLCNVPLCIEPTHLQLGTPIENANDRTLNGKCFGENHHNASITEATARAIKLSKGTKTQAKRAMEFNVPVSVVRDIDVGATWAQLPDKNGMSHDANSVLLKEKKKARRVAAKNKVWTDAQWKEVGKKLKDEKYVKVSDTLSHDGTPCVLWTGGAENGYGRTAIYGVSGLKVHILACTIGNGNVRPKDAQAAHRCGNSLCVEPKHLYFTTGTTNALDKHTHGTMSTKVTAKDVMEIRRLHAEEKMTPNMISGKYPISKSQVIKIIKREAWSHI